MSEAVIVVNAGSSSVKFSVFLAGEGGALDLAARGLAEGIGTKPKFTAKDPGGGVLAEKDLGDAAATGHKEVFEFLGDWLQNEFLGDNSLLAVGHRVVHGGAKYNSAVRVDDDVFRDLEALVSLAPLHQPHNLTPIRSIAETMPDIPQVACFDTAFHRHHRPEVDTFAIPKRMTEDGVQRYGFHGLSYEYIAHTMREVAPDLALGCVVVCHLGSGASMCGIKDGVSVDSTMGFTALDGLPMGTRCGSIDPGVLLHMMRAYGMDADAIERCLYHECGLKGVSGISNDMRDLETSDDPNAARAIDVFVYAIAKQIGALSAAMEGIDGLVFTAGIGEKSPSVREQVCRRAAWLGIDLDRDANERSAAVISTPDSRVRVMVIPTDEEKMIAMHTVRVLAGADQGLKQAS